MIPKKIHQIFFQIHKPLDQFPIFLKSIASVQEKTPEYEYKLWTETEIDELINTDFRQYYYFYHYWLNTIQKLDFARWLIMYKYGGIYMDLDMIMLKRIDDLLNHDLLLAYHTDKVKYRNGFFGSIPENPVWLSLLKNCEENYEEKRKIKVYKTWKVRFVLQTTGPAYVSREFNKVVPDYKPIKDIIYDRHSNGELEDFDYYFIDYILNSWASAKTENNWIKNSPETQKFIQKYTNKIN